MEYLKFQRKISRKTVIIDKVLFDSFYFIVVMLLTYQHNKILMRAKPRALLVDLINIQQFPLCL